MILYRTPNKRSLIQRNFGARFLRAIPFPAAGEDSMVEQFSFGAIPSTLFAQVLWVTCAVCCCLPVAMIFVGTLCEEVSRRCKEAHSEGKPHRAVPNFGPTFRPS